MNYVYKTVQSPVGELKVVARGDKLAAILWENDKAGRVPLGPMVETDENAVLNEAAVQLGEYFAGTRKDFTIPMELAGTEFQQKVWRALLTIPYGETRSYGDIARQIGHATAVRPWAQPMAGTPCP